MQKEIVLPPHLYDRIKASAGEHGGIGIGRLFSEGMDDDSHFWGTPLCAHGHAWGTCTRWNAAPRTGRSVLSEPELTRYLPWITNDTVLYNAGVSSGQRIPFERWCELLNVKRGKDEDFVTPAPSEQREAVTA